MRNVRWLASAGLVVLTAGCVQTAGYPTTYGYGSPYGYSSYGYSGGYYSRPIYYRSYPTYYRSGPTYYAAPRVVTRPRYVPVASPRYYRDRNRDGVPDKWQRRHRHW